MECASPLALSAGVTEPPNYHLKIRQEDMLPTFNTLFIIREHPLKKVLILHRPPFLATKSRTQFFCAFR
jgi:hypothetical protein